MPLEAAARWYAEQLGVDRDAAAARVADDLRLAPAQFDKLPQLIDDIDARNARFSGVALRKLMYLLRQDTRTEGQLQLIVDALARDQAPDLAFDIYRCELLADGFLYTPPRRRPRPEPQPLARRTAGGHRSAPAGLAPRLRRPFARSRVEAFVDGLLRARASAAMTEAAPETDEDYVRLIYTVAYGLDGGSSYSFQADGGTAAGPRRAPRPLRVPARLPRPAAAPELTRWTSPSSSPGSSPPSRSGSARSPRASCPATS